MHLRYNVYDASTISLARPLLLKRQELAGTQQASSTAPLTSADTSTLGLPHPGDPGRWALPADPSGLADLAATWAQLRHLATLQLCYSLVQGVIAMLAIIRLMTQTAFQPRLSIITGTLAHAIPDLASLSATTAVGLFMLAMVVHLGYGWRCAPVSSISGAVYSTVSSVLAANGISSLGSLSEAMTQVGAPPQVSYAPYYCFLVIDLLWCRIEP